MKFLVFSADFVTIEFFVLVLISIQISEIPAVTAAGYNEYCNEHQNVYCSDNETMVCTNSTCKCKSTFVFAKDISGCVTIASKWEGWDCMYDIQCKESKYGEYSRCSTGKYSKRGSCECHDPVSSRPVHLIDGICIPINESELSISSFTNQWSCHFDYQCTSGTLGKYSRCNTTTGSGTGYGSCECFDTDGLKRKLILMDNVCYLKKGLDQTCKTNAECNATIAGEAICLGAQKTGQVGVCKCAPNYYFETKFDECLKLGTIRSICKVDVQCNHLEALGPLSRCHEPSKSCQCWDVPGLGEKTAKFSGGRCHYARGVNQTCSEKLECVLGFHKNADCVKHESYKDERVCQCSTGMLCNSNSDSVKISTMLMAVVVFKLYL